MGNLFNNVQVVERQVLKSGGGLEREYTVTADTHRGGQFSITISQNEFTPEIVRERLEERAEAIYAVMDL
tara:strand:- start:35 stop:244 length:210 start_codon:yes stop_codon:yes gene_type:complete